MDYKTEISNTISSFVGKIPSKQPLCTLLASEIVAFILDRKLKEDGEVIRLFHTKKAFHFMQTTITNLQALVSAIPTASTTVEFSSPTASTTSGSKAEAPSTEILLSLLFLFVAILAALPIIMKNRRVDDSIPNEHQDDSLLIQNVPKPIKTSDVVIMSHAPAVSNLVDGNPITEIQMEEIMDSAVLFKVRTANEKFTFSDDLKGGNPSYIAYFISLEYFSDESEFSDPIFRRIALLDCAKRNQATLTSEIALASLNGAEDFILFT